MRALAAHDEREEIRGSDSLAELFLSEVRLAPLKDPALRHWVVSKAAPGAYEYMIARTAFFDQVVKQALLDGLSQLVLLGAGYDSRPYRFRELARETKIFELDAPPTQQRKREILARARVPRPPQLKFVPIDFGAENLAVLLLKHGFSRSEKALFVWEGVMYYLSAEAVDRTFASIKSISPAGSSICFDYASISPQALSEERTKKLREHMKSEHAGEPARFGIPDGQLPQFLSELGYQIIENLGPAEMEARYLTLRDKSSIGKVPVLFSLAHAEVTS
jgi:methyltransferase (TIGR00027 family)